MDIVATFAPPRLCKLGGEANGRIFWLRPYTLEDFALLIAWLDDVLPGREDRKLAPKFGSAEAQEALQSRPGFAVVCYASLRHHGVSYSEACELAFTADDAEKARLYQVLFARRRYGHFSGAGDDIAEAWWGPDVVALAREYHHHVAAVGGLTFDQLDCLATEGAEGENPSLLTVGQVQAMWEAARAAKEEAEAACTNGDAD